MICSFSETQFDLNRGQHITVKHPKNATGIICSNCMQVLIASSQEKIKKAYQKAIDAGLMDKAKALETFLEEEIIDNGETKNPKRGFIRKGPMRLARPSRNEIRA
jgi:hypothetical protein